MPLQGKICVTQIRSSRIEAKPAFVILLVEDFRPLLLGMQNVLESSRYRVFPVNTPAEALLLASNGTSIHLLITRLMMPGMTGPELAARIRWHKPGLAVLYMSDDSLPWRRETLEAEIRDSLLPDPFSDEVLLDRVRAALQIHA
jgi:two-component system cell cycle sensor histidine kinase/response regulator CckA